MMGPKSKLTTVIKRFDIVMYLLTVVICLFIIMTN